jgi:hypothetical protein
VQPSHIVIDLLPVDVYVFYSKKHKTLTFPMLLGIERSPTSKRSSLNVVWFARRCSCSMAMVVPPRPAVQEVGHPQALAQENAGTALGDENEGCMDEHNNMEPTLASMIPTRHYAYGFVLLACTYSLLRND